MRFFVSTVALVAALSKHQKPEGIDDGVVLVKGQAADGFCPFRGSLCNNESIQDEYDVEPDSTAPVQPEPEVLPPPPVVPEAPIQVEPDVPDVPVEPIPEPVNDDAPIVEPPADDVPDVVPPAIEPDVPADVPDDVIEPPVVPEEISPPDVQPIEPVVPDVVDPQPSQPEDDVIPPTPLVPSEVDDQPLPLEDDVIEPPLPDDGPLPLPEEPSIDPAPEGAITPVVDDGIPMEPVQPIDNPDAPLPGNTGPINMNTDEPGDDVEEIDDANMGGELHDEDPYVEEPDQGPDDDMVRSEEGGSNVMMIIAICLVVPALIGGVVWYVLEAKKAEKLR